MNKRPRTRNRPKKTKKEKSAGAIVFRMEEGVPVYLLLHYPSAARAKREYWDLPKGHIEGKETEVETARREIREETGISKVEFLDNFYEPIHYYFQFKGTRISKTVIFFLARTEQKKVQISHEHVGYKWLPYEEALEQLTFENARRILRNAHAYLNEKQED